ncbi:PqqD family protein [Pseudoxanthomonas koreensis]|uniref:PqqD family protein n=1 Tax=Pseudoxanthomonas koreensis TaxID=266061 RepID=UPI001391D3CF|nr:PqqD family protein [Pseudoxanthomonas koreensis]KAF1695330.1 PqqD family protein [Pseudoxanthomonas koreensis]
MTATPQPVTLAHSVHPSDEVLKQEVGDEVVLLDLASERYFGLDPVGTRIWELMADGAALAQVHAVLCTEFEAEPERIQEDLLGLVRELSAAGLVRID